MLLEPITVADVRAFLSLSANTDEDSLLEMLISGVRAQAETYLRRRIAMQDVAFACSYARQIELPDVPMRIGSVVAVGANGSRSDVTDETVPVGCTLLIGGAESDILQIEYTSEMYCPADVRNALLMAVRNAYVERSSDPMTDDVRQLLAPHRRLRI